MGRKSSSKGQSAPAAKPPAPSGAGLNPLVIGAILVAVIGIGALAFWGGSDPSTGAAATATTAAADSAQGPAATPEAVAKAEAQAKLGPRTQTNLPPIPFQAYQPPRSHAVITAAYNFAAEHPEILSYVPCFCGCERSGHGANHDCFVKARNENGDVVEWDQHGVDCAVCIDVANRSRQMHASGASVRDIRAAIDKEFGSQVPSRMGTPHPPAAGGGHGAH